MAGQNPPGHRIRENASGPSSPQTERLPSENDTGNALCYLKVVLITHAPTPKHLNVLAVDDEAGTRMALDIVLKLAGHHPVLARDGDEALALYESAPDSFDLIITDHQMVRVSGLDLVRRLREEGFHGEIVVLTAYAGSIEADQYKELEVAGLMEKPFNVVELRQWLSCIHGCREHTWTEEDRPCTPEAHYCWLRCAMDARE